MKTLWESFLPKTRYDHPLAVWLEDGDVKVSVGGNRHMTAVVTPEEGLKVAAALTRACRAAIDGPMVKAVEITLGAPPVPIRPESGYIRNASQWGGGRGAASDDGQQTTEDDNDG